MASVSISVRRGDGLTVEYEYDDMIVDSHGQRTRAILDRGVEVVRAGLRGSEPSDVAEDASS